MTDQHDDFAQPQARQADVVNPYDQPPTNPHDPPPPKKSWVPACLIGCGVVALIALLLCGVGGYWAASAGPGFVAEKIRDGLAEQVESSDLPEEEKAAIIVEMDRVVVAIKQGDVDMQNVERTMEELADSPLVVFVIIAGMEEQYLKNSDLSDEDMADAKLTIQRIYRGVKEEKIEMSELEPSLEHIGKKNSNGGWELKQKVSDEELRTFLAECKQLADDAEIPNEPFDFVLSEEVRKIADTLLGVAPADEKAAAEAPSPSQPAEIEEIEQVPSF